VVRALRTLMPAVVVEGTASEVAFPSGTAGKTGTAEFGSGKKPPSHAWFIGYRGDLAFSMIVEGGGAGPTVAAPIASRFLTALANP
jgi:cell division protein FtsI/penicillin-binding protein 2